MCTVFNSETGMVDGVASIAVIQREDKLWSVWITFIRGGYIDVTGKDAGYIDEAGAREYAKEVAKQLGFRRTMLEGVFVK